MKQFKFLLASLALLFTSVAWAQTDVTSTYVANADFSSIVGWTQNHSSQYWALGNGLIGTFNNYEGVATVDDTHLSTEYCIGLECRWSTNFASYTQTTVELPAGVYTLTFDVENVNSGTSKASYENRFFVQIGDNKITDSAKEWMNAKSSWTTHSITFTLDEPAAATISLGYGTGSNNIGSGGTPRLYVSHLKLTYTDLLAGLKTQLASVQATATELLENPDYDIVTGEVRTTLQTLSTATAASETAEAYEALIEQVKDAIAAFEAAKPLAENTAAVAGASKDNPVVTNFVVNGTFSSNTTGWSSTGGFQNRGTATNQSGDFTTPYWENWDPSAKVNKMYQVINNIPNGTYELKIAAFVNKLATPEEGQDTQEVQYVFANSDKTYLTTGTPTFYTVYTYVTGNTIEIGLEQIQAVANWMGIDNVSLTYYGADNVVEELSANADKIAWQEALAAAQQALADNPDVVDPTKGYLETEVAKSEPTTNEGYQEAAAALRNATSAFLNAAEFYNTYKTALQDEIAYAQSIGVSTTVAEGVLNNASSTSDDFISATEALKVLEYNTFAGEGTEYTEDVSTAYVGTWVGDIGTTASGQHWDGSDATTYMDSWSGSARTLSLTQTISLPAGDYVFMTPGRGVRGIPVTMTVGDVTVAYPTKGDTGYGIDVDGKANFSSEGHYAYGNRGRGWEWRYITVSLAQAGDVTVTLTLDLRANSWGSFTDMVIRAKFSLDLLKSELEALQAEATELLADANYANVSGDERSELVTLSTATPATQTKAAYEALIAQVDDAIKAFKAAKPLADKKAELTNEIAYAEAIGVETSTAESALAQADATIDDIQNAINDLKVLDYETFAGEGTEYTEDVSDTYVGAWTSNMGSITGQHWDGSDASYMDSWSGSAATKTATQTITLPAGEYVFMIPGRAVAGITATLTVNEFSINYNTKGDTGYGIDTNGKANFSSEGATYANNNIGRGWEWRFVPVTLTEKGDVTVTLTLELLGNTWGSFTDLVILAKPSPYLVLDELKTAIDDANAIAEAVDVTAVANGDVFQVPVSAVQALNQAIHTAQAVYDAASTKTMEEIQQATTTLLAAIETFNNSELNAPEDGAIYNVALVDEGCSFAGKPITFKKGQPTAGGYAMGYTENPGSPYNQAIMFEPAEETNCYYWCIEDAAGTKLYVGTGSNYSGNNYQLRMTDDKEKALALKAERKGTNLSFINTATNSYVGSNGDTGFFTADKYHLFKVSNYVSSDFSLPVKAGKYGTVIFPYIPEAEKLAGLNFYTCESIDGTELVLTEVDAIEIDKPYIVENTGGEDVSINENFVGKAYSDDLTFGLLTGLYSGGQGIPAGNYVLQTKDGVQSFRKVPEGGMTGTKYRAYLTYDGGGGVNALGFKADETTAIRGIDAVLNGEGAEAIYDATGKRIASPQKGLNIIKMSNGKTVKVLIK